MFLAAKSTSLFDHAVFLARFCRLGQFLIFLTIKQDRDSPSACYFMSSCNNRPDKNAVDASIAADFCQVSCGLCPSGELMANSAGDCPEIPNTMKEVSIVLSNFCILVINKHIQAAEAASLLSFTCS